MNYHWVNGYQSIIHYTHASEFFLYEKKGLENYYLKITLQLYRHIYRIRYRRGLSSIHVIICYRLMLRWIFHSKELYKILRKCYIQVRLQKRVGLNYNACKIIQIARKLDIGYSVELFVACKLYRSVWAFSCFRYVLPERVPRVAINAPITAG